ncbi:MAG: rhodanese-like domain-containing protein [Gammaproteobacteria bacterium]|nr:rhodanese-like domain-containing protein [Gammaproteobacteria bacterium]
MKIAYKVLVAFFATALVAGSAFAGKKEVPQFIDGTVRVSAEEMIDLVEKFDELVIIDSRKKSDVAKGFIEGAVSLPNTDTNADSLAKNIPSKSTPVVFYCNGIKCGRSVKAAKIAIAEGYTNIYWFRGGMQEWEAKGLPVVHP